MSVHVDLESIDQQAETTEGTGLRATDGIALFGRLIHTIHHPVWIADLDGCILFGNPFASSLYGYNLNEWQEQQLSKLFCSTDAQLYRQTMKTLAEDGYVFLASQHQRKDLSHFPGEVRIHIFNFPDQSRLIVTGSDISDLAQATHAFQESRNRFKMIFDHSASGIATILPEGYFLQTNQAFCKLTGYTQEQLTETTVESLIASEERGEFIRQLKTICKRKHCYLTLRMLDSTQQYIWVTISLAWVEEPGYVILLIQNIDAYKNMEMALRSGEAKYRSVIENVSDAIIQLDARGLLRFTNQAWEQVIGWTNEASLGRPLESFVPVEYSRQVRKMVRQLLRDPNEKTAHGDFRCRRQDGSECWIEASLQSICDKQGKVLISGTLKDVSERKAATAVLEEERRFLQTIIDGVMDPILVIDLDRRVRMMNQAASNLQRPDSNDPSSHYCYQAYFNQQTPCEGASHPCPLEDVLQSGMPSSVVHCQNDLEGNQRIFQIQASPWLGINGQPQGLIESIRDITGLFEAEAQLQEKNLHLNFLVEFDGLTGLPNREFFFRCLQQSMQRASRTKQLVAILQLDLDRFRNINDNLGHRVGDQILKLVAERLKISLRDTDLVARLADDEFAIILEQINDPEHAASVAEKIVLAMGQQFEVDGYQLYVTASIGMSVYPHDAEDIDNLLKMSDTALALVKSKGRNNYQFFTPEMADRSRERLLLEHSFRQAIDEPQLIMHYQPQLDLYTGHLKGMEALVRWQHPERGMMPPGDFIPLAEETGLIVPMGEWVLREACRQNARWLAEGAWPIRVTVNISARQFLQADLIKSVQNILDETGLPATLLELEITESMIMSDVESATAIMRDVSALGVHLAIDDFGTGYSSLAHLKRFPLTSLKIDRAFVMDVLENQQDAAIVNSIIVLAHNLNLQVIAEGIETEEQYQFLKEKGCEQGQGFLFSRPMAPADVVHFFRWKK